MSGGRPGISYGGDGSINKLEVVFLSRVGDMRAKDLDMTSTDRHMMGHEHSYTFFFLCSPLPFGESIIKGIFGLLGSHSKLACMRPSKIHATTNTAEIASVVSPCINSGALQQNQLPRYYLFATYSHFTGAPLDRVSRHCGTFKQARQARRHRALPQQV
ncbi:hypothetical protein BGZ63DRAFT_196481 [Mariannaea sp. PMI_226]|nr:hypothetical protein BGZ63DRAFT_196481 [Mariannaea sp. PMI_226]